MGKMKNYILFCLYITTLAFALIYSPTVERSIRAASFPAQAEPVGMRIWQILPGKPLVPEQSFSLYTSPPGQFVVYGRREYGINLDWAKRKQQRDYGAPANFTLSRASGTSEPIKYGEAVALREQTGGYIYYKPRKYGINLEFSGQPVYEWEVRGGRTGTPVTGRNQGDSIDNISDVAISLYNRTINCYVVYGKREYGINLVWKGGSRC
jgi:hypothetical protein